jgi:hypothetical protein
MKTIGLVYPGTGRLARKFRLYLKDLHAPEELHINIRPEMLVSGAAMIGPGPGNT